MIELNSCWKPCTYVLTSTFAIDLLYLKIKAYLIKDRQIVDISCFGASSLRSASLNSLFFFLHWLFTILPVRIEL